MFTSGLHWELHTPQRQLDCVRSPVQDSSTLVTSENRSQTSCNLTLQVIQCSALYPKCWRKQWRETAHNWFSSQLQNFPSPCHAWIRGSCWHLSTQESIPYHPEYPICSCSVSQGLLANFKGTKSMTSLQNEILLSPANPLFSSFCSVCFSTFLYLLSTMWYFYTYIHSVVFKPG